jgi:hypothetical protein
MPPKGSGAQRQPACLKISRTVCARGMCPSSPWPSDVTQHKRAIGSGLRLESQPWGDLLDFDPVTHWTPGRYHDHIRHVVHACLGLGHASKLVQHNPPFSTTDFRIRQKIGDWFGLRRRRVLRHCAHWGNVAVLKGHTSMNVKVLSPVMDGIRGSFKLSAGLVLAVVAVISSFADHSPTLRNGNDRSGHGPHDSLPRAQRR